MDFCNLQQIYCNFSLNSLRSGANMCSSAVLVYIYSHHGKRKIPSLSKGTTSREYMIDDWTMCYNILLCTFSCFYTNLQYLLFSKFNAIKVYTYTIFSAKRQLYILNHRCSYRKRLFYITGILLQQEILGRDSPPQETNWTKSVCNGNILNCTILNYSINTKKILKDDI